MTAITPGNPARSVELTETEWNTLLEPLLFNQLGAVQNVVTRIREQLNAPPAENAATDYAGTGTFVVSLSDGDEDVTVDKATEVDIELGHLIIADNGGTIAIFAPGRWTSVREQEIKEAGDGRAASSS